MKPVKSFYEAAELTTAAGGLSIVVQNGHVQWTLPIPKSLTVSTQDHEALLARFVDRACRVIRVGGIGSSAGWHEVVP